MSERLQYKLMGDWQSTLKMFSRLGPNIKEASIKAQMKICKQIEKEVKNHLINQDLPWVKLNQKYARKKAALGRDSRTLLSLGTYYHSITTWQPGNRNTVLVGVKRGIYTKSLNGKNSKLEVAKIAAIHEFSNSQRPPRRPLWNPTIEDFGGPTGIRDLVQKSFVGILRRKGVPIKKFQKIKWH